MDGLELLVAVLETEPAAVDRRFLASATAPVPVVADRVLVEDGRGAELMEDRDPVDEGLKADELLTELVGLRAAAVAAPVVVVEVLFSLLGELAALLETVEVRRMVRLVSSSEADTLGRER